MNGRVGRRPARMPVDAAQLRLALAPACEWHSHADANPRGARAVRPCMRDGEARVTDPVRGRTAVCCVPHALLLVAEWRATVPNRRRNCCRVAVAWLPGVRRRTA